MKQTEIPAFPEAHVLVHSIDVAKRGPRPPRHPSVSSPTRTTDKAMGPEDCAGPGGGARAGHRGTASGRMLQDLAEKGGQAVSWVPSSLGRPWFSSRLGAPRGRLANPSAPRKDDSRTSRGPVPWQWVWEPFLCHAHPILFLLWLCSPF